MGKHRLNIGDTFFTTTKRMSKDRRRDSTVDPVTRGKKFTYEVLRPGAIRIFQKGKRLYECSVLGLQELRTGLYPGGKRWWQFMYQVEVLKN